MLAISATLAVLASLHGVGASSDNGRDDQLEVELVATPIEEQSDERPPVLDRLAGGDVLDISVVDGAEEAEGTVRQCVRTISGLGPCTNHYPVRFDHDGRARFQYQLIDPGDCGPDRSCVLVVDDRDGRRRASAVLVFGAAAPPLPTVEISPTDQVAQGDRVRVDVSGLSPGAQVRISYCDPGCNAAHRIVADSSGRASGSVVVGTPCDGCGVAVIAGAHDTRTPLSFAPVQQPGYDTRRLAVGLGVAAMLLATAWRIITAVDWRPPSEADTPDLDAAKL